MRELHLRLVCLECNDCGKKIGMASIKSTGATHQWIERSRCMECAQKHMENNREELEKAVGKEKVDKTIAWLEEK